MKKAFVLILIALPAIESFGWSMLAGTVGTLILAGFFSGIMSLETLSILLPMIVGANAALGSFIVVNALCFKVGGFFLMSASQGLVATATGIVGGWSGGVLAVKYKQLQGQVPVR